MAYRLAVFTGSIRVITPLATSRKAVFAFFVAGSTRGVHPSSNCLARAPATATISNLDFFTRTPSNPGPA
jgi:hypothetical protein